MLTVKDFTKESFIERVSNGHYTALYHEGVFVGGLTIRNNSFINGSDIFIETIKNTWFISINNHCNALTIIFDSFEN